MVLGSATAFGTPGILAKLTYASGLGTKKTHRITLGLLMAALIVSAAMLMQVSTSFRILGYPGIAIIFFFLAAVGGVGLMLQILRDDRIA